MAEYVVDTNVWVMPDRDVNTLDSAALLECAKICQTWLVALRNGANQVVTDDTYAIIGEYRRNLRPGGFAEKLLNELMKTNRVIYHSPVVFQDIGSAAFPNTIFLNELDPSDRKFVAVALAGTPPTPIVNATDSDWREHLVALDQAGLTIIELCLDCIQ